MTESHADRIATLKRERNAVIMAHNYCRGEVQDVADIVGDSLELARKAADLDAAVIVFCGVHFMAETAAILCPDKQVLMPDRNAGCPMANMATARELEQMKRKHPEATVVTYVNSSAATKALSDICCTSSNALAIVEAIPADREVIFVPDRNLGGWVAEQLGRELILWDGCCPTHDRIRPEHVRAKQALYPDAVLAAHPECPAAVRRLADYVGSTSGILRFARETDAATVLVATEHGILHRLQKENPEKRFVPASEVSDCPDMKLATLQKLVWRLEDGGEAVTVDPETAAAARKPIERMLEATVG